MSLREEAIKYVNDGLPRDGQAGTWSTWNDVHRLITEHDSQDHPPVPEGMEAFEPDPYDGPDPPAFGGGGDGDGEDEEEDAGDDGEAGGEDEGGIDDNAESDDDTASNDDSHYSDGDGDGGEDGGDVAGEASATLAAESLDAPAGDVVSAHSQVVPAKGITVTEEKENALKVLIRIAQQERNDPLTRQLRKTLNADRKAKQIASTDVAIALGKRAHEAQVESTKRFRAMAEEERQMLKGIEDAKVAKAAIDLAKVDATLRANEVKVALHFEEARKMAARQLLQDQDRWLQTQYACILFDRCQKYYKNMDMVSKNNFVGGLKCKIKDKSFERPIVLDVLNKAVSGFYKNPCKTFV